MNIRSKLRSEGFVRVDGILQINVIGGCESSRIAKCPEMGGRYDQNNGVQVVVLGSGEVWVRAFSGGGDFRPIPEGVAKKFEKGAFVPFSNGELADPGQLMARIVNPDCSFPG